MEAPRAPHTRAALFGPTPDTSRSCVPQSSALESTSKLPPPEPYDEFEECVAIERLLRGE